MFSNGILAYTEFLCHQLETGTCADPVNNSFFHIIAPTYDHLL
uniref:Uncharacterized protein n=1 Tax=Arundo donax TaxID=35708 RepID=A0A0A9QD54_ARUDO